MDQQRLQRLLGKQKYMVLAVTLEDGTPWAVPVRVLGHSKNEFTWDSRLDTVHSIAITERPSVAVTMFYSDENEQTGLYMNGTVRLVEETKPGLGRYIFVAKDCWLNDETFVKRPVDLM